MVMMIEIPDAYIPKHQNIIDLRLHFKDGHIVDADGYGFRELSNNICTQKCCLKNHNVGIIECNEEYCSNRTKF